MTNTQELPITPENIANLKVGDEVLVGISREKSHWLPVERTRGHEIKVRGREINGLLYDTIVNGSLRYMEGGATPPDIHAIRKAVVIPDGWTKYDPAVLPPENAAVLEMMYNDSMEPLLNPVDRFVSTWSTYNTRSDGDRRTMYRVTKWKTKSALQQLAECLLAVCLCGEYTEEELVEKLEAFAKEIRG